MNKDGLKTGTNEQVVPILSLTRGGYCLLTGIKILFGKQMIIFMCLGDFPEGFHIFTVAPRCPRLST